MDFGDLWSSIANFTAPLIEPFKMGAQATADAFQQDVQSVSQGQLPQQAGRALGDIATAYDNPLGVVMPYVPAAQWATKAFDPQAGWQTVRQGVAPMVTPISQYLNMASKDNFLAWMLNQVRRQQLSNMGMDVY